MTVLERILDEQGTEIAIGLILGVGFLIYLVVMIALGDRKPPDKNDGP